MSNLSDKIACWVKTPLFRRQLWQRWASYWKWQRFVAVLQWQLFRWYLTARNRTTARLLSTRMFISIFRSVAGPTILAVLTLLTLNFVQRYIRGSGIWGPESSPQTGILLPETYSTLLATLSQCTS